MKEFLIIFIAVCVITDFLMFTIGGRSFMIDAAEYIMQEAPAAAAQGIDVVMQWIAQV